MRNKKIEVKWAIVFIIASLIWMVFEKSMGWHDRLIAEHASNTLWFIPFAILLYILAIADKKKNTYNGQISWMEGFKSGVLISLFIAILTPISQFIIHHWISPAYFNNIINYSLELNLMTLEQANDYFSYGNYIFQSTLGVVFIGVITSAIVAFFLKSKKIEE